MRTLTATAALLLLLNVAPVYAQEAQKPEAVVEKMSFKLVRGLANATTGLGELPKQTYLTVKNRGDIGYVIGPIKGVGMALYRTLIGLTETVFFMVPQPGYYDPMIDPEFVWDGWDAKRADSVRDAETLHHDSTGKGE